MNETRMKALWLAYTAGVMSEVRTTPDVDSLALQAGFDGWLAMPTTQRALLRDVVADSDGVPVQIAQHAEIRGRRLHIDDQPFPWATCGEIRSERADYQVTLWVPVTVHGPVTITPRPHPAPGEALEDIERDGH